MVKLSLTLRPRLCKPPSDDEHNEDDEENDEHAENLYHQPAIRRHRLEIFDEFGVRCFYARVGVVDVCVNSRFHTQENMP